MKALIIVIAVIGIAAVAGPIIVGIESFDGTVTENSYEKGLLWDDVQKKKAVLGWNVHIREAEFRTGVNDLIIYVQDKSGRPLAESVIAVMIGRSATSEYDKYADAVKLEEGLYSVKVNFPLYGYWDVTTEISLDKSNLSFEKRIYVEKGG